MTRSASRASIILETIVRRPSQLGLVVGAAATSLFPSSQTDSFEVDPPDRKRVLRMALWVFSVLFLVLVVYGLVVAAITESSTLLVVFLFLFILSYAGYLHFHLKANNVKYLRNIVAYEGTGEYVADVTTARPKIIMKIRCYHQAGEGEGEEDGEGRVVIDEEAAEKGGAVPGERVYTFSEEREFLFDQWEDISDPVSLGTESRIVKLKLKTRIGFADSFTKEKFEEEQARFISAHRERDTRYEYETVYQVPHLRPKILSVVNVDRMPLILSFEWYLLFTIFLAGWPYAVWLDRRTVKVNHLVKKVVRRAATPEELARRKSSGTLRRLGTNSSIKRMASGQLPHQAAVQKVAPVTSQGGNS